MSIRPIDSQVVVQKIQEVHHGKQHVVNKTDNELVQMQHHNKLEANKKLSQVDKSKDAKIKHIQDEEESRKKKKEQPKKQNKKDPNKFQGLRFDMKV